MHKLFEYLSKDIDERGERKEELEIIFYTLPRGAGTLYAQKLSCLKLDEKGKCADSKNDDECSYHEEEGDCKIYISITQLKKKEKIAEEDLTEKEKELIKNNKERLVQGIDVDDFDTELIKTKNGLEKRYYKNMEITYVPKFDSVNVDARTWEDFFGKYIAVEDEEGFAYTPEAGDKMLGNILELIKKSKIEN